MKRFFMVFVALSFFVYVFAVAYLLFVQLGGVSRADYGARTAFNLTLFWKKITAAKYALL